MRMLGIEKKFKIGSLTVLNQKCVLEKTNREGRSILMYETMNYLRVKKKIGVLVWKLIKNDGGYKCINDALVKRVKKKKLREHSSVSVNKEMAA